MTSSSFNRKSTAEQVTEGVDLSGKAIVITGVGSGIGQESMRVLAMRGAHVIGLDRTLDAAKQACDSVSGSTSPMACDLSDPESITACADEISKQASSLNVLLGNAGVMATPYAVVDKYKEPLELQFAVNFMGHFLLINRLMPLLKAAPSARIAPVASEGYVMAPKKLGIDFDNLDYNKGYDPMEAYGQSKLAVMLMSSELARRLEGSNITCNSIHPGVINTNLGSDSQSKYFKVMHFFSKPFQRSIEQGAATNCFVAAHPSLDGASGGHFADCKTKLRKYHARDMDMARRLWEKAEFLAEDYLSPDAKTG